MAFFLIVPSVMIVSIVLVHVLTKKLGLHINYATLTATAVLAIMADFAATLISPAGGKEFLLRLGLMILGSSALLTFANNFLLKKQREEEERFTEEVKAAYAAEVQKNPQRDEPSEKISWGESPPLSKYNELFKVEPVDEKPELVPEVENADEKSELVPEVETIDEKSEPVSEVETADEKPEPVSEVETADEKPEPVAEVETVDEKPEPVSEVETVDEKSEPVAEVETVDEKSEPVSEVETVDEKSEPVSEVETVDEKPEPVAEVETVDEKSEPVSEVETVDEKSELFNKSKVDAEVSKLLNEKKTDAEIEALLKESEPVENHDLPEEFPLEEVFEPLPEVKPEEADKPVELPDEKPGEKFPLEEVFKPLPEVKPEPEPELPKPDPTPKHTELFPLQEVFQPLSTLRLDKLEEMTRDERNSDTHDEPEETFETLDDILDKAYAERSKGHVWQAIELYKTALDRYRKDDYAPFVAIDLGNIYKEEALYSKAIKVYERALNLPAVKENAEIRKEFVDNLEYLRVVRDVLLKYHALSTPFAKLSKEILQEIDTEFRKVQFHSAQ